MPITTVIDQFHDVPIDGQPEGEFVPKANNWIGVQLPNFVTQVNDLADEINDAADDIVEQVTAFGANLTLIAGYSGRWIDATGPATAGSTYAHSATTWVLNIDVAEVSEIEPGTDPSVWTDIISIMGYVPIDLDTIYIPLTDVATASDFFGGVAGKVLTADVIQTAYGYITLTPGATIPVDMATGINFRLTTSATCEISTPTGAVEGKSGIIVIDLTGAHDVTFATGWTMGEGVDLAGTSGTRHVLSYVVLPGSSVLVNQIGSAV